MRLAIIGSRGCPPIDIAAHIDTVPDVIVSGGAKGADTYAREYAEANGIELVELLPDYRRHGRRAPLVRDRQIIDECDCVLAFWDGKSNGTRYTLGYAGIKGVPAKVVMVDCGKRN